MLVIIPEVLDAPRLKQVHKLLDAATFVDGRLSAGAAARRVKQNEELADDRQSNEALNNLVMGALVQHPLYQSAVLPVRVAAPFYVRYRPTMAYGDHIDDPVMGPVGQRYRSDVAITIFLNAPDEYEGGELLIHTSFGAQRVKLPAGHAVTYPASTLHKVTPITRGTRLVAVTWAQSMIRDPAQRELLFDLNQAREQLLQDRPDADETKRVDIAYANLVRMWAQV